MKKFSTFSLSLLVIVILSCCFLHGCKKHDAIVRPSSIAEQQFLTVPATVPASVKRIADIILLQNERYHFIDQLVEKEGNILWDKAQLIASGTSSNVSRGSAGQNLYDSVVILPFVYQNQKQVSAFLACGIKGDSMYLKLHRARMYSKYKFSNSQDSLTANAMTLEFLFLNKAVFGDSVFRVTDKQLFKIKKNNGTKTIKIKTQKVTSQATALWISFSTTRCYSIADDGNQGQVVGVEPGGTNNYPTNEWICYAQQVQIFLPDYGAGGGEYASGATTVGADPVGGGGVYDPNSPNHWWWSNEPCPDPNGWQEPDAPQCNGGTVLGWQPLYPFFEVTSDQNPFTNPCLYAAKQRIGDVTLNIFSKNLLWASSQNPLRNWSLHFGESTDVHDENGVPVAGQTAMWKNIQVIQILMNTSFFNGTTHPNSSHEFATAVMLHEITHAFLDIYMERYGLVDFSNVSQHEVIFKNFVNVTKETLMQLFPTLNSQDATALAIQGTWDVLYNKNTPIAQMDQFAINNYNISLSTAGSISQSYRDGIKGTKCFQ